MATQGTTRIESAQTAQEIIQQRYDRFVVRLAERGLSEQSIRAIMEAVHDLEDLACALKRYAAKYPEHSTFCDSIAACGILRDTDKLIDAFRG